MPSTDELLSEIELHKEEIARKKRELTESIRYASNIQSAIFPDENTLGNLFPSSFVLFKPKDIVSGDFYWIKKKYDKIILAAADCTGHGVPGAFMSILGISLLNDITSRETLPKANRILNTLREAVMKSLNQTGEDREQRDGMDIALCIFDLSKNELEFAGANNPLYLVRDHKLLEYKPDRMPIGITPLIEEPFKNNVIELRDNDKVYIFSDGFPDQFGGDEGKKLKYKQFRKLILDSHHMYMEKQRDYMYTKLIEWKGDCEQVDDILLIGVNYKGCI